MPGRNASTGDYRYGFNGMEGDDEIKGSGNSYDFGARMYDSRLGKWLSVDPLASRYQSLSPYVFVANMPLKAIDPDGEKITIVGSAEFITKTKAHLAKLQSTEVGRQILETLMESGFEWTIGEGSSMGKCATSSQSLYIQYYPDDPGLQLEGASVDGFLILVHELFHAYNAEISRNMTKYPYGVTGFRAGLAVDKKKFEKYPRWQLHIA